MASDIRLGRVHHLSTHATPDVIRPILDTRWLKLTWSRSTVYHEYQRDDERTSRLSQWRRYGVRVNIPRRSLACYVERLELVQATTELALAVPGGVDGDTVRTPLADEK